MSLIRWAALSPATLVLSALSLGFSAPALAEPARWTVDKSASSIDFSGTHAGRPFEGTFETWDATIAFDPADLAHSSATVTIKTASAKTDDPSKDSSLVEEEWFNPAQFPDAIFKSNQIVKSGNGYVASGTLTIKGKTLPVMLPFTLTIDGDTAKMSGDTTIDRLAYELGVLSDGAGTFVSRDIALTVSVTATKAP